MEWQIIVALVVVIPIILIPVAFIWYLDLGGMVQAVREARQTKMALEKKAGTPTL